jgi:O-antigen/teichoic acid export membrane protein
MSEKRRIVVNTLFNGIAQFAAVLSALVFMPLLIKGFGATDYGLYLLASSAFAYASLLDLGVGASLTKMTAEAAARNDRERLGRLTTPHERGEVRGALAGAVSKLRGLGA